MRLLTAICLAALVVCFTMPAFAETQNIKVSGDIKVANVYQNDLDFTNQDSGHAHAAAGGNENDSENFFLEQVGLNIEADLTDNVSTYVRLIQERAWVGEDGDTNTYDVSLDEAYMTLKEMLYAPLTLKIGRQNLWLGKGFVIGNSGATVWDEAGNLPTTIHEVSDMTAFDAIRATLDYDPWTINLIYSKIAANGINDYIYDDSDLYVVNVGYKFTKYDAEAEAYYILKHDKSGKGAAAGSTFKANATDTFGLRGSFVPFENMNIWAEGGLQIGDYNSTTRKEDRQAYAFDIGGDYTFTDVKWTPKLGLEVVVWSGENASVSGKWEAWEPLYPGKYDTYLAAFRNITKLTDYDVAQGVWNNQNNNGATNENQFSIFGSIEPMTDVGISARYTYLLFDETPVEGRSDKLGQEIDGKITYDYTEDVQISVAGGVLIPGQYYPTDQDATASQVITAVQVDF